MGHGALVILLIPRLVSEVEPHPPHPPLTNFGGLSPQQDRQRELNA
jgi:hypothetical protein